VAEEEAAAADADCEVKEAAEAVEAATVCPVAPAAPAALGGSSPAVCSCTAVAFPLPGGIPAPFLRKLLGIFEDGVAAAGVVSSEGDTTEVDAELTEEAAVDGDTRAPPATEAGAPPVAAPSAEVKVPSTSANAAAASATADSVVPEKPLKCSPRRVGLGLKPRRVGEAAGMRTGLRGRRSTVAVSDFESAAELAPAGRSADAGSLVEVPAAAKLAEVPAAAPRRVAERPLERA
jgi:hypothetical protein